MRIGIPGAFRHSADTSLRHSGHSGDTSLNSLIWPVLYKTKDLLLSDNFVIEEIEDWKAFLAGQDQDQNMKLFKKHARIGKPLGQEGFIENLEKITSRILRPQKPGRKKK
ncbi:MAG: hypothetical protein Q7J72_01305 [Candidatus Omnitrophota bacterium]|nr:hypothetical protein [Candidatus Omnitrophota bacterium]